MPRLPAAIFCAVCLGACGGESEDQTSSRPFVYAERAAFDPALRGEVEVFIRGVARRWELELQERPFEQSMFQGTNHDGFSTMAYIEGDERKGMVFWISNHGGGGNLLSLSMDYYEGGLPRICVDRLHEELKSGLEEQFGLDLYPVDKSGRRIEEGGNQTDEASP